MDNDTAGVPAHHIAGTNFIMVHLDLVDDLDGDFLAALLLDRIRFRAGSGWWTATYADLIEDTRLSEHQVKRCLKKLREVGYLESKRVSPYDPTQMFRLVVCEECAETDVKVKSTDTIGSQTPPVREDSTDTVGPESPALPLTKNSRELSKNPPISPNAFDEFWTAYPRKEGKGQARPAFNRAEKKVGAAVIIAATVEYRQWCESEGKEKRFIPMPSTWLNGERWSDERVSTQEPDRMQGHLAHIRELWENEAVENPRQLEG